MQHLLHAMPHIPHSSSQHPQFIAYRNPCRAIPEISVCQQAHFVHHHRQRFHGTIDRKEYAQRNQDNQHDGNACHDFQHIAHRRKELILIGNGSHAPARSLDGIVESNHILAVCAGEFINASLTGKHLFAQCADSRVILFRNLFLHDGGFIGIYNISALLRNQQTVAAFSQLQIADLFHYGIHIDSCQNHPHISAAAVLGQRDAVHDNLTRCLRNHRRGHKAVLSARHGLLVPSLVGIVHLFEARLGLAVEHARTVKGPPAHAVVDTGINLVHEI